MQKPPRETVPSQDQAGDMLRASCKADASPEHTCRALAILGHKGSQVEPRGQRMDLLPLWPSLVAPWDKAESSSHTSSCGPRKTEDSVPRCPSVY